MRRLLIRPGAIGDVITSLPALASLCTEQTEIWAPSAVIPLLEHLGRATPLAATGIDRWELGLAAPDRLRGFDSIVSWYGSAREEFRRAVADYPVTFFPALPVDQHAVDFYNAQARSLGGRPDAEPRLPFTGAPRGTVVIHPFSGGTRKNWPLRNFRAAAARLRRVEWCAGPEEPLAEAQRFDDLATLARWLAGARLYIGNDSGITHLAAALGVPVIAIFVDSDPQVWAPRGRRVRVLWQPSVDDLLAEADRADNEA